MGLFVLLLKQDYKLYIKKKINSSFGILKSGKTKTQSSVGQLPKS